MESSTSTLALIPGATTIVLLIVAPIFLLRIISRLKRKPYPPGPKGLPIIGNMMMTQLTHRRLASLAKQYGEGRGLLHLRMGFLHIVVISSPEMARQVLQVQDIIFSNRPTTVAIRYLTYNRADMAFAHYGPFWRQMRKLCVMKLFSRQRAESWQSIRDEVNGTVWAVAGSIGQPVNLGELIFTLNRNIICRAAFGTSFKQGQGEFMFILQEFSKLFGAFNVADCVPFLGWMDPQGINGRLTEARKSLDRFIDKILDDHIERKKAGGGVNGSRVSTKNDIVDELLAFYSDEAMEVDESDDLHSAIELTRDNIKGIIMDVLFGGTETVASAVEWVMAELMKSPEDMKRVQQELEQIVGLARQVNESDLDNLPFFRCIIKETLRLHPPIPILLHETSEATEVAGYHIPAKARIMINTWAIMRDKDHWPDPDTFNPARFLQHGAPDFKGTNFEFIPFGSGRRSCPGMQLGLYALEMAVASLVHCFTWELPNGMKPSELSMDDVFGLTVPRASRLIAVPRTRIKFPLL